MFPHFRHPTSIVSLLTLSAIWLGAAPLACSDQPGLKDDAVKCDGPSDCSEGQVCSLEGVCKSACTTHDDCASGQFCASWGACEAQCASCGSSCTSTEECPTGQHCSRNTCQQECTPGSEGGVCGTLNCNADGKCAAKDDIVVPMGGAGGMSGDGDNVDCIDLDVTFEPQIPNVVLLIDQSGSMDARDDFDDAVAAATDYESWDCGNQENWRWNVVRNVLLHPENGVVLPLEDRVRFGLALYSSENGNIGGECPLLTEVDLNLGNHEAMLEAFECSDILTDTPTRESLTEVAEKLAAMDVDGPKVIVLATDGAPDTCECANWNSSNGRPDSCVPSNADNDVEYMGVTYEVDDYEQIRVALEAQRIYEELGITVEVINVSSPSNTSLAAHLDDVAERGGAVSGASIPGFSPGALVDAFESIIDGVRSCAIDLDGSISPGKENTGTVSLNGEPLILNDPDGWIVNSPTQIELQGEACELIKTGDHDLSITFPCGTFIPVPK